MSGTVCCYKGCSKSYSNDKDVVSFFKFPEEPKRRRKWMENCANPELVTLNDRQLRLKRVCSDHFSPLSFMSAETRNQITEKAVPLSQKEHEAAKVAAATRAIEATSSQKRRGRPPKFMLVGSPVSPVKSSKKDEASEDKDEDEDGKTEEEEEEDVDDEEEEVDYEERIEESASDDEEYAPPPMLKRQIKQEVGVDAFPKKAKKGRPPKPKALTEPRVKAPVGRRKSGTVRKMADLSVIDDVVNQMRETAEAEDLEILRKRAKSMTDKRILNKRRRSSNGDPDLENSDEELDDEDDDDDFTDEDDEDFPERANREFEKFKETLKNAITLPKGWGMGGVIWDPFNKTKVIAASEADVQINGLIRLKRAVQIFEDTSVRITIDGIDMTINFGVKCVTSEEEVEEIINRVARAKVCNGVVDFEPDDMIYLPDTKKRGCKYYSEACPVIITKDDEDTVCGPCASLQESVSSRKEKEQLRVETRKTRPVLTNLNHHFGKSLYGLLQEILDDAEALKSDKKQEREAILSKYSNELSVMTGDITKHEKAQHVNVSVDEVSASFQDIVSRLGFATGGPASSSTDSKTDGNKAKIRSSNPLVKVNRNDTKTRHPSSGNKIKKRISMPKTITSTRMVNHVDTASPLPVSASNSTNFAMSDGQEYELIGEVGGNAMVQVLEMNKDAKHQNEGIEIIEVDDETMAKITAQNAGMFYQSSGSGGAIQVLDASDPNISQILKAMNSSQEFKAA